MLAPASGSWTSALLVSLTTRVVSLPRATPLPQPPHPTRSCGPAVCGHRVRRSAVGGAAHHLPSRQLPGDHVRAPPCWASRCKGSAGGGASGGPLKALHSAMSGTAAPLAGRPKRPTSTAALRMHCGAQPLSMTVPLPPPLPLAVLPCACRPLRTCPPVSWPRKSRGRCRWPSSVSATWAALVCVLALLATACVQAAGAARCRGAGREIVFLWPSCLASLLLAHWCGKTLAACPLLRPRRLHHL